MAAILLVEDHAIFAQSLTCVMLSGHLSRYYVRTSLEAGAPGYLVKDRAKGILAGIRRVLEGEIHVSEELRNV